MSSKQSEESFLQSQSEERHCFFYSCTDDATASVQSEEAKNPYKEDDFLARVDEETLEIKASLVGLEDVGILNEGEEETHRCLRQRDETLPSITEESGEDDRTTVKTFATLAEPEESESEYDPQADQPEEQRLVLYENVENEEACDNCFKILEENSEHLAKLCGAEKAGMLRNVSSSESIARKQPSCKFPPDIELDSSGSFRASLHSLATCQDSLASSRRCPSRKDLCLELDLECRICHDAEGQDLISPCHCAGTSKWVHESCIIKWIRHTKTKKCEICTCPITVKRKKKPIDQWTRPSATCGPCNKLDIWYCFVLALCVFIIIGFVVLQSRYDVTDQIETTVIFASIYVLCGMIIMMKARYFWTWFVQRSSFWGNWKNLNEEWRIIEANEANVQTPVSPV